MKYLKKVVPVWLVITIMLSFSMVAFAADTYSVSRPCPKCEVGSTSEHKTRVYQHDETFTCRHGGSGRDVYGVYEVTITESCNRCNYRYTYSYEQHVLKYCTSK